MSAPRVPSFLPRRHDCLPSRSSAERSFVVLSVDRNLLLCLGLRAGGRANCRSHSLHFLFRFKASAIDHVVVAGPPVAMAFPVTRRFPLVFRISTCVVRPISKWSENRKDKLLGDHVRTRLLLHSLQQGWARFVFILIRLLLSIVSLLLILCS